LTAEVEAIDRDIPVLLAHLERCKVHRITAHLVRGLKLKTEARELDQGSARQVTKDEAALSELREALNLDGNDLDTLEEAAKQARRLGLWIPMNHFLARMEHAAQEQRRYVRYARALRFKAETLEERGTVASKKEARSTLESAVSALSEQDSRSTPNEKLLEVALGGSTCI
jgi:hypothetical protein